MEYRHATIALLLEPKQKIILRFPSQQSFLLPPNSYTALCRILSHTYQSRTNIHDHAVTDYIESVHPGVNGAACRDLYPGRTFFSSGDRGFFCSRFLPGTIE